MLKQSSNIGDIVISPLLSKIHLFSMKPNRFFAKKELPLLFRCNFLTPKYSSLKWLLSNRDIFFLITKIFESWISIDTLLVNVSFVLPINNIRECNLWRDSFRFLAYFLNISQRNDGLRKIVCPCMNYQSIRLAFKNSSTALRISSMVAPGWLLMDIFLDFESPRLLVLFNIESPTMTTFLPSSFLLSWARGKLLLIISALSWKLPLWSLTFVPLQESP